MLERFSVFLRQVAIGLRALSLRTPFDELHLARSSNDRAINPRSHQRLGPTKSPRLGSP